MVRDDGGHDVHDVADDGDGCDIADPMKMILMLM